MTPEPRRAAGLLLAAESAIDLYLAGLAEAPPPMLLVTARAAVRGARREIDPHVHQTTTSQHQGA